MSATLDQMKRGERGSVVSLSGSGAVFQRLQEMGIIEGADLEVVRFAPLGDPMEILVQNTYHLLIRKSEAACVEVST